MWNVDDCATHGCASHPFQNVSFFYHSFWPCLYVFFYLTFPVIFDDCATHGCASHSFQNVSFFYHSFWPSLYVLF